MSIGENIRNLRKKAGLTQRKLAEKVGVNEVTIRSYEAEKYNPKMNALTKLCIALDCKITDLIDEDSKKYYRMFDNMDVNITPSGDIICVDSDVSEYNRIIDKQINGEGFTPYDKQFISDFIDKSPLVRDWFIENGLKSKEKNLNSIKISYEHLNKEGQKEAAKRVKELTEIERYTKPDEWFKGKPMKEEINQAVEVYLNNDPPTTHKTNPT